jgi:hypothetical protein
VKILNKVQEFKKIADQMADTYAKKNENYGDSFGDTYEKLGAVSGLVRLYDKLNRATSLVNGGENHYESLEDTFIDMACYAIMNVIELRKQKEQDDSEKSLSPTDNFRDVKEYYIGDYPINYGNTGGLVYSSPCSECSRRFIVGACDGCQYNVILTNNCSCTSGGTK